MWRMSRARKWREQRRTFLRKARRNPDDPKGQRLEKLFEIIHEDPELLVINKPAGLVCHPTKGDAYSSLISRTRLHLGTAAHPQLVNRLDRETSGVTLVAKDDSTARALRRLWESRQVFKEYVAIVHGLVAQPHGVIQAPLGKDEQSRVAIKDCVRADGAPAETEYWVIKDLKELQGSAQLNEPKQTAAPATGLETTALEPQSFTVLRVAPKTGRKHQIRIHLAHIGHPIVGDKLYGADEDLYLALVEDRLTAEQRRRLILPCHALHAQEVRFHWQGKEVRFHAEPEAWFKSSIATVSSH